MSDVTRQPGGIPVERDRQTPDARGETALGTTLPHEADPAPGARADHAAGTRGETTPGLRTDGGPGHTSDLRSDNPGHASGLPTDNPEHASGLRSGNPEHTSGLRSDNPDHASAPSAHGDGALLPHDELDKLGQRLQHAVAGFVDAPRASVEEADRVLEEIAARFTDAVTHRRKTLRTAWHDTGADDRATSTDTEQLRLALRDYRELADRLMHL
ncbi:hypothetical protein SAM23877_2412 [Streptomyces ambofaciens ATCC 23877]|uniref:Uncharacterized protein n=1 Tax=Streptomyces ambofaciens (strain ATCC 23877 / 3486 / DSM 40053 / JCM 4204 / NBRC 12836 / NRRL B-2516) TaxID=278992 RepID=A0A0K2ARA5_STRA7|nr:hypothetical protein [Streptomyces ambofaciens]AKZ55461.1 hypothetical protein SAM23877_2412 [Streptomyces ambofaciens ATCC 23877]